MDTSNQTENSPKITCTICDYICFKNSDMNKHCLTKKHIVREKEYKMDTKDTTPKNHICECGKEFAYHSGLWKHKKKFKCSARNSPLGDKNNITPNTITPDLIIEIIKQNQELQKQNQELTNKLFEVCKNGTYNNSNNTNNSNNKTFNLQFFLNETCKDAMNIMDFIDSIQLQLSDLEKVGKIGYVEGISNIIVKNLNSLDETKRPVHCTDSKREVMYIKDENKWEKENEEKKKLRKVIKYVAHKNSKLLKEFKSKHPDCEKSNSKFSDQYNILTIEAMGGKGNNDLEKEDKIITNIAKEVTIDKNVKYV
jgi:hypothetical protein